MLHSFGQWADVVYTWGYIGIFVALIIEGLGLPFPGDAVMAFYGVAAAKEKFHVFPLITSSIIGYLIGALICYFLSYRFGSTLLERASFTSWFNQRSMTRTSTMLSRYGPVLLIPGRFLPGVRSVSSYVAGAVKMEFAPFLLYTLIGVIGWCSMWVLIGYWFGENLHAILQVAQSSLAYITGGCVSVIAVVWVYRRRRLR